MKNDIGVRFLLFYIEPGTLAWFPTELQTLLANKSLPNEERVRIAHQVMTALLDKLAGG